AEPGADAAFDAFRESHDLSRAVKGAWPEPLWILRRGLRFHVWSRRKEALIERKALFGELTRIGEQIAERILGSADERAVAALSRWRSRETVPAKQLVAIATGLPEEIVVGAAESDSIDTFWEVDGGEPTELAAAARMVGTPASAAAIRAITTAI